ncbi:uncharacterized protein PSANT_04890 [Moesziomyces antarcticus]|uniref:Peptidase metallopeptidase domain-containing protein n=1 Tax=Pseudozyma antarctica TaxID=84753 RepID=A0A5C3FSF1_PSEA2|nr:uncharacterized protein PSANT_04890 [Moesziomyces antarcticus]
MSDSKPVRLDCDLFEPPPDDEPVETANDENQPPRPESSVQAPVVQTGELLEGDAGGSPSMASQWYEQAVAAPTPRRMTNKQAISLFVPPPATQTSTASATANTSAPTAVPSAPTAAPSAPTAPTNAPPAAPAAPAAPTGASPAAPSAPRGTAAWGGHLAACQRDRNLRLFLARGDGKIAEFVSDTSPDGGSASIDVAAGTLNTACLASSRIAATTFAGDKTIIVYQNAGGSICQRILAGSGQAWNDEEVVVAARDQPLAGTTLAAYETADGVVLFWQNTSGALMRKLLDGEDTVYPLDIKGETPPPGFHVHVNYEGDDQPLTIYWQSDKDSVIYGLRGPPSAHKVDFTAAAQLKMTSLTSAFAVVETPVIADTKAGGPVFYYSNPRRRCIESTAEGEITAILTPASAHIDPNFGYCRLRPAARAADDAKATKLLCISDDNSLCMLIVRDAVDLDDDKTQLIQLHLSNADFPPSGAGQQPADNSGDKSGANSGGQPSGDASGQPNGHNPQKPADDQKADPKPSNMPSIMSWIRKTCKEVLTPDNLQTAVIQAKLSSSSSRLDAVFASTSKLWDGDNPQKIYYGFLPGEFAGNELQQGKVRSVIDEWTWYANVQFIEGKNISACDVRIRFNPKDGSWSYVGTDSHTLQLQDATMNLAWVQPSGAVPTKNERAVILHEFGHVLGLLHEHQSPAHGGIAVVNEQAALDMYRTGQHWPDKQIYDQVINVYKITDVSNFSEVDTTSIMHYPQPKELTGLKEDIGYNKELSDLDKAYMVLQYPRDKPHAQAPQWTFDHALAVIKCPESVCQQMRTARAAIKNSDGKTDLSELRKILGDWSISAHSKNTGTSPAHDVDMGPAMPSSAADPAQPLHGDEPPPATPTNFVSEGPFIKVMYDKLLNFFPPGDGQYFALQFPTRYLDKASFAYDTSSVFSRFEKPVVVNEAEFRLTDDLFNLGPIVGGPNGQSLSNNYVKVLNSLVPSYEGIEARKQRELMRSWLLAETHPDEAAFISDSRLVVPNLDGSGVAKLAGGSGVQISTNGAVAGQLQPNQVSPSSDASLDAAKGALRGVEATGMTDARLMTRMEFSNTLTMEYLGAKQKWELDRDAQMQEAEAKNDPKELEKLTRKLAHITGTQNAILSNKYANAVVRGHTHTVRELLGHLDIRTTAEMLQDAKDALRESALSSLYTASSVYPVQLEPTDWFQALDTGFTREDLSQTPELMEQAIHSKSMQIEALETRIATLRGFQVGVPEEAEKTVKLAADAHMAAMGALSQAYTENTISAVKLAITIAGGVPPKAGSADPVGDAWIATKGNITSNPNAKSKLTDIFGPGLNGLDDIGKQITNVTALNMKVNAASRALTDAMAFAALAKAGDTHIEVENTQRALTAAKDELQELQDHYGMALKAQSVRADELKKPTEEVGKLPAGNGGSRWIDLSVSSLVKNDEQASVASSSAKTDSFSCNFWLGSVSRSSSSQSASVVDNQRKFSLKVTVNMRVTYITVDRSGWFDPSIAQMSGAFMHVYQGDDYASWSTWGDKVMSTDDDETKKAKKQKADALKSSQLASEISQGNTSNITEGYLSAFPVGYVLVKDCVIQVESDSFTSDADRSSFKESSSSSGGFLCFSTSSSSSKTGDSSHSSSTQTSDGMVIRIPGPQILGYMMQLVHPDKSREFVKMPTDYLFEEMQRIDAEDKNRGGTSGGGSAPAHGVNPDQVPDQTDRKPGVRRFNASGMFRDGDNKPAAAASASQGGQSGSPMGPASTIDPNAGSGSFASSQSYADQVKNLFLNNPALKDKTAEERQNLYTAFEKALEQAF